MHILTNQVNSSQQETMVRVFTSLSKLNLVVTTKWIIPCNDLKGCLLELQKNPIAH